MKKHLAVFLALALVLAFAAPVLAAPADTFSDVPQGHWAYAAIQQLAKDGIVEGYGDGTFRGDRTMTRYEMAMIVANAMTKEDKANAQQKALIDKLAREFNADLVKLGARVTKVEQKAKVNFFFDNRIEGTYNSLGKNDLGGWPAGTYDKSGKFIPNNINDDLQFMERIRVYMNVPVGDRWQWDARLVQAKWNFESSGTENVRFDRFWMTGNNILGGKVEMGKMMLYPGKGAFFGNTGDTEGIYYTKQFDKATVRLGAAESNFLVANGQSLRFAELTYRPTKKMDFGVYTLSQNYSDTIKDLDLRAVNGAFELPGGLAVSFEWARNENSKNVPFAKDGESGYFVALQSKYAATNYMPALYTSMVNPFVKGDHGWGISYRHLPTGVAGVLNRGAFSWIPLTTDSDGSWQNTFDNVNAWRLDYVYVPWKNVQWTLTYDRIKPIKGDWTNDSIQSTFNFFF